MTWYKLAIMKQSWNWKEFFNGIALSSLSVPFLLILLNISNADYSEIIQQNGGDESLARKKLEDKLESDGVASPERFQQQETQQETYDTDRLTQDLARHEGTRLQSYDDSEGNRTVGIGFNLDRAGAREAIEAIGANFDDIYSGTAELTRNQANNLLQQDLGTAVQDATNFLPDLNQHPARVQEAIINMAFNLGGPRLRRFQRARQALQNFDYDAAADEMLNSRWAGQVGNRANELADAVRSSQ